MQHRAHIEIDIVCISHTIYTQIRYDAPRTSYTVQYTLFHAILYIVLSQKKNQGKKKENDERQKYVRSKCTVKIYKKKTKTKQEKCKTELYRFPYT